MQFKKRCITEELLSFFNANGHCISLKGNMMCEESYGDLWVGWWSDETFMEPLIRCLYLMQLMF